VTATFNTAFAAWYSVCGRAGNGTADDALSRAPGALRSVEWRTKPWRSTDAEALLNRQNRRPKAAFGEGWSDALLALSVPWTFSYEDETHKVQD